MKKTIIMAALAALSFTTLNAQTLIPKAGLTLSKVAIDDEDDEEADVSMHPGFTIGVAYAFNFTENFSLQPELSFIQKGFRVKESYSSDGETFDDDSKNTFNYFELPVLAKYSFGSGGTKFFLVGGPSLGIGFGGKYKTKEKYSYTIDDITYTESESYSGKIKFGDGEDDETLYVDNSLDVGFQLGAGVVIAEKVQIDIRYGLGLTDLSDDAKSKNRVLQFTVGVPISF